MSNEMIPKKPMVEGSWTAYGRTYKARVSGERYAEGGGRAIEVETWEPDGRFWEPWCTATVNLPDAPPPEGCVWIKEHDDDGVTLLNLCALRILESDKAVASHASGFVVFHAFQLSEKGLTLWPDETPWFSEHGELLRPLPQACLNDCAIPGAENYDACKALVARLGLTKGLDLGMVRGHLLETGGWNREELLEMTPEELAIKLLWNLAWTIRDQGNQDGLGIWAEPLKREGE